METRVFQKIDRAGLSQIFSRSLGVLLPILSILLALVIGALVLLVLEKSPIAAYIEMFQGAFGNIDGITQTLTKATPMLLVALGICVAFRGGVFNIGGEGQLLIGAIVTTVLCIYVTGLKGWQLIILCLVASSLCGAIWGGIAGFLKAKLGVNEILSTVMMNAITLQLSNYLLSGPLMDPKEVEQRTFVMWSQRIPRDVWLAKLLPPSSLHSGLIIALIMAVIIYVFLWRTTTGYRIRAVGFNPDSSRYAGINVPFYQVLSLALAGALAGLAGGVEILGIHHKLMESITGGYGYSGIVAALFGGLHPLGAIPASILFGGLLVGGNKLQRAMQVPQFFVGALLGLIVIFVVSSDYFVKRQARIRESKNV